MAANQQENLIDLDSFLKCFISTTNNNALATQPFFSVDNTVLAMDKSGSTSGAVLAWSKNVLKALSPPNVFADMRAIGWESHAVVGKLENFNSSGGTNPECIFPLLEKNHVNLLITTDGDIGNIEVH